MKKLIFSFFILLIQNYILANDGAFYAKGNQLIPIQETDISIQKEILTLKKVKHDYLEVNVYYEFYNPSGAKNITVGFEAFSPAGDVDGAPKNGNHPYMNDFTVNVNNQTLKHKVAYVSDTLYAEKSTIKSIDLDNFDGYTNGNYVDFFYVYYFEAHFKKGLNIIKHTYTYDLSGGICVDWRFDYVLTAANRWANNQIDDFTLIVDCGGFESFDIENTFFSNYSDWLITGIGKANINGNYSRFHIHNGSLIYQQKNFHPKGELSLKSEYCDNGGPSSELPLSYYSTIIQSAPVTELEKKVFKNLPFARRGYIFKTQSLQEYYEKTSWYIPNPNYIPNLNHLHAIEKEWVEKYR